MGQTVMQRAFAGGELAPALHARADQAKYISGLRTCRNFLIQRHGGVTNRAGTRFINTTKEQGPNVLLFPYVSDVAGESMLVEVGLGYIRFYRNGALLRVTGVAAWSNAATYAVSDLVSFGGVNYYCYVAHGPFQQPDTAILFWYPLTADIYEVPLPFFSAPASSGGDFVHWEQSGRVVTLTSQDVRPYELINLGTPTRWYVRAVTTAPALLPPTGLVAVPDEAHRNDGELVYQYCVTAVQEETYEESVACAPVQCLRPATTFGHGEPTILKPNVLRWNAVAGAVEYHIYVSPYMSGYAVGNVQNNRTFGFIGTATGTTTFADVGLVPDFAVTPPLPRPLFATPTNYPNRASHYQQRRFFAATGLEPDSIWGSRTGFDSNFAISSPIQDDDAITFRLAGSQFHPVRHLIGLKQGLVILTDSGEWTVKGAQEPGLTPSNLDASQEGYVGAADVRPVVVGNAVIYVQARGSLVRDLKFEIGAGGFLGSDLTLFAGHLFDGFQVTSLAYAQTPHSIVWVTRSDGTLLGLTYIREEDIWGWHRHDTGASGQFEHVCVVPEATEDALYVVVRRVINGTAVRYIERLEPRAIVHFNADCFFVDAGLSYSGPPVTTITGLDHLEGELVSVVADGLVVFDGDPANERAEDFRVTAGTIAPLAIAAADIHAGLPVLGELETLDLDVQGTSLRDKQKKVTSLSVLLVQSSRRFTAGIDASHQTEPAREAWINNNAMFTGQLSMSAEGAFDAYGRVLLQHQQPLPLTVLGFLPNVDVGG